MRKLESKEVEYKVEYLPEDTQVIGNAMASGDPEVDREVEGIILRRLESGDNLAWCCVRVTAEWGQWTGEAYLGCCSYDSEKDFVEWDCCADMEREALDDLNRAVAGAAMELSELS